jgi:branched-chain amino acid transport system substrate-binding protein
MGLSLIWGVMRVINLAHGATMALGMFCIYYLFTDVGVNPYVGLLLVVVLALIFGFIIYMASLHRVIQAGYLYTLLATFAVNMINRGRDDGIQHVAECGFLWVPLVGPIILQGTRLLRAASWL